MHQVLLKKQNIVYRDLKLTSFDTTRLSILKSIFVFTEDNFIDKNWKKKP